MNPSVVRWTVPPITFAKGNTMKSLGIIAAVFALAVATPALSADLELEALGGVGLIGGGTLSGSFSHGEVSISRSLNYNGTTTASMDGYGLAESSLKGDYTTPGYAGVNGVNATLNLASGSLSTTGATLNGTGSAVSNAHNLSGAGTITVGGGIGAVGSYSN